MELKRNPKTLKHEAKVVKLFGRRVRIDTNIALLVEGIAALGIRTTNSCGGSCGSVCSRKHRRVKGSKVEFQPFKKYGNDHRGYWVGKRSGPALFRFDAHLTFPHAHLDLVTRRVLEAGLKL